MFKLFYSERIAEIRWRYNFFKIFRKQILLYISLSPNIYNIMLKDKNKIHKEKFVKLCLKSIINSLLSHKTYS